jgi:hypothetical protein
MLSGGGASVNHQAGTVPATLLAVDLLIRLDDHNRFFALDIAALC